VDEKKANPILLSKSKTAYDVKTTLLGRCRCRKRRVSA